MKKFLFLFIFLPGMVIAFPRNKSPQTPEQVYQNDLDVQQEVNNLKKYYRPNSIIGSKTFTGNILLPDGLVGTPSISFVYDPDTGMYRSNTNEIGFSCGGVGRYLMGTGSLYPLADNAYKCGDTSNRWSALYTVGIVGTTTNNNASAGNVGEYIEAKNSVFTNLGTSSQFSTINSIVLTAGDWDVSAMIEVSANGATVTGMAFGIGTADGNDGTGLSSGENYLRVHVPSGSVHEAGSIPSYRVSINGTTTEYLKCFPIYTVATPQSAYRISARRMR
jgi:hypothetical protein